jgi:large subunit ribosomal protein L17e
VGYGSDVLGSDGHTRVVLSKALNSSFKNVRLFATKHLTFLLQESPVSKDWLIGLLVTQLYDTSTEVRELAVSILNDVCKSSEILELVVEMRPSLDHLGSIGAPLLFR